MDGRQESVSGEGASIPNMVINNKIHPISGGASTPNMVNKIQPISGGANMTRKALSSAALDTLIECGSGDELSLKEQHFV